MGTLQSTRLSLSLFLFFFFFALFFFLPASWFPPTSEIPAEGQRTSSFVLRPSCERKKGRERERNRRAFVRSRFTGFDGIGVAGSTDWRKRRSSALSFFSSCEFIRARIFQFYFQRNAWHPLHHLYDRSFGSRRKRKRRSERGVEEGGRSSSSRGESAV